MMGAVLINENDEVMFFNPAAEKLWGYKREEVIGNNIDMLIPRDLRPAHPEYIRHNREGGKARVEGMSRELQLEKKTAVKSGPVLRYRSERRGKFITWRWYGMPA